MTHINKQIESKIEEFEAKFNHASLCFEGFEDGCTCKAQDFLRTALTSLARSQLEGIEVVFSEVIENVMLADGFVGASDAEWAAIKRFLPILHQPILHLLSEQKALLDKKSV